MKSQNLTADQEDFWALEEKSKGTKVSINIEEETCCFWYLMMAWMTSYAVAGIV